MPFQFRFELAGELEDRQDFFPREIRDGKEVFFHAKIAST